MSEPELASELKATVMPNGSSLPLPKDTGWETSAEKEGEGENSVKTVEVERKEEKKDNDTKMEEMEDEKVAEAEDLPEDAKMTEPDDVEETKAKDAKVTEDEDAKKVEAEDGKVAEVEDAKTVESMEAKVEEPEGVTMTDAESQKDGDKGEEEGEKKVEAAKIEEGNDVKDEKDGANQENKVQENNEAKESKKKRVRGKKAGEKGDEKEKKESRSKDKTLLSTPLASSTERPVRERKTVERLVESLEKEPVKKFLIEKGRGTPLKEIPSVAYKLAKKKPADLKLLHQTLFGGRQGKVADFKNHILQFSGFVWHGDEEKQKTKVKDKLDKCVKDTLVDLCDLLDIPVSKTSTRKEELVAKLMDFMVVPHGTTDIVVLAEKEQQSTKLRKRKRGPRGSASKSTEGIPGKQPRRGISKTEGSPKSKGKSVHEKEEEEEDEENGVPKDNDALKHSESEEIESEEVEDDDDDDYSGKSKHNRKKSSKRGGSAGTKKSKLVTSPKKTPLPTPTKSPAKSSLKHSKTEDTHDVGAKVLPTKKKNVDVPVKKSTAQSDHKEKATGKRVAKGKAKSVAKESTPSKEELRKTICDILKEVDFNTVTFTDTLKELAKHYSMDLTPQKKSIKLMIQEELTKLADEAEENEEVEEDGAANEDGKPETVSTHVEA